MGGGWPRWTFLWGKLGLDPSAFGGALYFIFLVGFFSSLSMNLIISGVDCIGWSSWDGEQRAFRWYNCLFAFSKLQVRKQSEWKQWFVRSINDSPFWRLYTGFTIMNFVCSCFSCVICRLDYEDGETLTLLSCKHSYHPECINNWLKINKVCSYTFDFYIPYKYTKHSSVKKLLGKLKFHYYSLRDHNCRFGFFLVYDSFFLPWSSDRTSFPCLCYAFVAFLGLQDLVDGLLSVLWFHTIQKLLVPCKILFFSPLLPLQNQEEYKYFFNIVIAWNVLLVQWTNEMKSNMAWLQKIGKQWGFGQRREGWQWESLTH